MKSVKCIKCGRRAEFHLPDDEGTAFREDHAIEYLMKDAESFLQRIPEKEEQ